MNRLILVFPLLILSAGARIIVVPDSVSTISEGLNVAGYGDTVLVKPGEYIENISWPATDGIKLYSVAGPDSTIINGGSNDRVIHFGSSITRTTEIKGFDITGGLASQAAGIYTQGSPAIIGNKIRFNNCYGERNYGGGIFCASNTSPLIMANEITDNTCSDSATWNYGGGIYVDMNSTAEICYNRIARNTCSKGYWNYGAGIYVDLRAEPVIYQNLIMENNATEGDRGHGAGIYVDIQSHALIFSNIILYNRNTSRLWNYGAGIKVSGNATIINNTIVDNVCSGGNWNHGAGIYIDYNDTAWVKNNIIVQNSSAAGSGIYNNGVCINSYNDVWNNIGGNYYGCSAGPGDISQEPFFVVGANGLYYLSQIAAGQPQTSLCVDAGDTLLATYPLNLDSLLRSWTTRTDSVPDISSLDMGYHYPTSLQVGTIEKQFTQNFKLIDAFPNPFTSCVLFSLPAEESGKVRLQIFDVAGRTIYRSEQRKPNSGATRIYWDGVDNLGRTVPIGVYLFQLDLNHISQTGRLVKLE